MDADLVCLRSASHFRRRGDRQNRRVRNGHELVYISDSGFMAVRYTLSGGTFVADKPRLWIEELGRVRDGDLAPDGKRMLVVRPVEPAEPPKPEHEVAFLINFFDELRRRAPAGK